MNPFAFVPHNTGGMHEFEYPDGWEGSTIEVFAKIIDTGGAGFSELRSISTSNIDVTDIPEPSMLSLIVAGLCSVGLLRKRG